MLSYISLIVVNLVVITQDFRTRSIHWFVIPALAVVCLLWRITFVESPWTEVLQNWSILALQGIAISLYFSLKNKRWINPLDTLIGIGDILYLLCLGIAFPTTTFIAFMVTGFVFSLFVYAGFRFFRRTATHEIPLAGLMSLWMMIILFVMLISSQTDLLTSDSLIFNAL